MLFGLLLSKLDDPIAIDQAWTPFPDCVGVLTSRETTGARAYIEFEYPEQQLRDTYRRVQKLRDQDPSGEW